MPDDGKALVVGTVRESFPGERRVAITPGVISQLTRRGLQVVVQSGAGTEAGFADAQYADKGATVEASRETVFAGADVLLQVRAAGANPEAGLADIQTMRNGQVLIAMCDPLSAPDTIPPLAQQGLTAFSLEMLPRITRAQSMDVLSSMATVAGYKAVLLAANSLPRMFPMLMTAAGTVTPARVFIIGAGVAGLQAIATAQRLGAVVRAYDLRPAVREEVESLGAKFVELPLATNDSSGQSGGYAQAMDEDFYRRQRELMAEVVAESDIVITTAAVPGKTAPVLVTEAMVESMAGGSVIVDLAAERGGNCELTQPGETVVRHGVTILGPLNLPSEIPYHASQMFARNASTFLQQITTDEGHLSLNMDDEVVRETLITRDGEVVNPRVRELLGLPDVQTTEVGSD